MADNASECAQGIKAQECIHLREEIRVVPGVRKKVMVGRCLLKRRDREARAEITKAMQSFWATEKDHPDCWVFATGRWETCPRYAPPSI